MTSANFVPISNSSIGNIIDDSIVLKNFINTNPQGSSDSSPIKKNSNIINAESISDALVSIEFDDKDDAVVIPNAIDESDVEDWDAELGVVSSIPLSIKNIEETDESDSDWDAEFEGNSFVKNQSRATPRPERLSIYKSLFEDTSSTLSNIDTQNTRSHTPSNIKMTKSNWNQTRKSFADKQESEFGLTLSQRVGYLLSSTDSSPPLLNSINQVFCIVFIF